jgi:hypothetical protein
LGQKWGRCDPRRSRFWLDQERPFVRSGKVEELLETKHLAQLSDGVIEDYAEKAE